MAKTLKAKYTIPSLLICLITISNAQCLFPFADFTTPLSFHSKTNYLITPNTQFEVLGNVQGEASYIMVAGIMIGDAGYDAAYRNALAKIRGADALIDVKVDSRFFSFLGLFIQIKTKLTGKAIKFKPEK